MYIYGHCASAFDSHMHNRAHICIYICITFFNVSSMNDIIFISSTLSPLILPLPVQVDLVQELQGIE